MSNKNSTSLRRIRADLRELTMDKNSSDRYTAAPLEHDMFEWHFTIRGPIGTDYDNGIYHGRILLPPDYPYKPPHIIFLTPNGRFDINTKICLSFSAYHPELWQPAWGIRLILEALIAFLPTPTDGAIGAIDYSSTERKKLAIQSQQFYCTTCQCCTQTLLRVRNKQQADATTDTADSCATTNGTATCQPVTSSSSSTTLRFQKEIEELQRLQFMEHAKRDVTPDVQKEKEDARKVSAKENSSTTSAATPKDGEEKTTGEVTSSGEENLHNEKVREIPTPQKEVNISVIDPKAAVTIDSSTSSISSSAAAAAAAAPNVDTMSTEETTNRGATAKTTPTGISTASNTINTNYNNWTDHITNISMIAFAIICAILLRNIQLLLLEIRDLSSSQ